MRILLSILIALFLAVGVAVAAYAGWLGVVQPRGPQQFAAAADVAPALEPVFATPIFDTVGRPVLPPPGVDTADASTAGTGPIVQPPLQTLAIFLAGQNDMRGTPLTAVTEHLSVVVVDGTRQVPLAARPVTTATDGALPSAPRRMDFPGIPAGDHQVYLTYTPYQPWRQFVATADVSVAEPVRGLRAAAVTLDATEQSVTVVVELPDGFDVQQGPWARRGLDLVELQRDGAPRWRPLHPEIATGKVRGKGIPATVSVAFSHLGTGSYTLQWPADLRGIAIDPVPFTVPGPAEHRVSARLP